MLFLFDNIAHKYSYTLITVFFFSILLLNLLRSDTIYNIMDVYHENQLPNYPRFYMWQLQDNIHDYDTGGFMKFKLYGNSKSRPVGI